MVGVAGALERIRTGDLHSSRDVNQPWRNYFQATLLEFRWAGMQELLIRAQFERRFNPKALPRTGFLLSPSRRLKRSFARPGRLSPSLRAIVQKIRLPARCAGMLVSPTSCRSIAIPIQNSV